VFIGAILLEMRPEGLAATTLERVLIKVIGFSGNI
jgi:hypothetical protein